MEQVWGIMGYDGTQESRVETSKIHEVLTLEGASAHKGSLS